MVTIRMQRSVDTTLHDDILLIDRDQNNALDRIWKKNWHFRGAIGWVKVT